MDDVSWVAVGGCLSHALSMAEKKRNLTSDAHRNDWSLKLPLSNFNLTMFMVVCFPGESNNAHRIGLVSWLYVSLVSQRMNSL